MIRDERGNWGVGAAASRLRDKMGGAAPPFYPLSEARLSRTMGCFAKFIKVSFCRNYFLRYSIHKKMVSVRDAFKIRKALNAAKKTGVRRKRVSRPKGAFAKKVLAVVAKKEETKYVAEQKQLGLVVGQALSTPANLYGCLPAVSQGVGDFQRIGEKIQPVRARIDFTFNFTTDNSNNQDIIVNLWIVMVKGFNSEAAYILAPTKQFLQVGNGTNRDPDDPSQPTMLQNVNHMPLNKEQYTGLKHYRFRMRKGTGIMTNQGPATITAPTGTPANEGQRYISYSWKPPTLKYNDNTKTYPTSHFPVYGYWATNADGSAYGDTIQISSRTHLWFKDS